MFFASRRPRLRQQDPGRVSKRGHTWAAARPLLRLAGFFFDLPDPALPPAMDSLRQSDWTAPRPRAPGQGGYEAPAKRSVGRAAAQVCPAGLPTSCVAGAWRWLERAG